MALVVGSFVFAAATPTVKTYDAKKASAAFFKELKPIPVQKKQTFLFIDQKEFKDALSKNKL